jgi:hypothetical protein
MLAGLIMALNAGSASAASKPIVAVADQKINTYTDKLYTQTLRIKKTRIVVPWDSATHSDPDTERLLGVIKAAHVEVLVHFGKNCPTGKCKLPSVSQYTKGVKAFHSKYKFVKLYGAFNEANHGDQPTHKNPKRAAEYFNALQKVCKKCTVVAADLLDDSSLPKYLATFMKTAKKPKVIGLHNYKGVNDRKAGTTQALYDALKDKKTGKVKQQIWFTETGGLNFFKTGEPKNKVIRKRSDSRQAAAIKFMFKLALQKSLGGSVRRIYIYNWRSDGLDENKVRFDAGLVDPNDKPRKAFNEVQRALKSGKFAR